MGRDFMDDPRIYEYIQRIYGVYGHIWSVNVYASIIVSSRTRTSILMSYEEHYRVYARVKKKCYIHSLGPYENSNCLKLFVPIGP